MSIRKALFVASAVALTALPSIASAFSSSIGYSPFSTISGTTITPQNGLSFATTTSALYVDVNRSDSYTPNGSILNPYKSLSSAIANEWPGATAFSYNLAGGLDVEASPLTFPTVPFTLIGNESTLADVGGCVTMQSAFDIYDYTISAPCVLETDPSNTSVHQFTNGVISSSLVLDGISTLQGEIVTGGSGLVIGPGTLSNVSGSLSYEPIFANAGQLNLIDGEVSTTSNTYAAINATSTYSAASINASNVWNFGSGGGININNGATSTLNDVLDSYIRTAQGSPSVTAGNAATVFCGNMNLTATGTLAANPTGTNWFPCESEYEIVLSKFGTGTTTPAADFTAQASSTNATTTVELGKSGQTKGTCIKMYRTDGSAIYAYVMAGATTFTLSTTANVCSQVAGF